MDDDDDDEEDVGSPFTFILLFPEEGERREEEKDTSVSIALIYLSMSFPAAIARASRKEIHVNLVLSFPSKERGLSDSSLHTFFKEEVVKCEHRLTASMVGGGRGGALE